MFGTVNLTLPKACLGRCVDKLKFWILKPLGQNEKGGYYHRWSDYVIAHFIHCA